MKPVVQKLAAAFNRVRAENPMEDANDLSTQLQLFLVASRDLPVLSEAEIVRIALSVGVPQEKLGEFMEELASWL